MQLVALGAQNLYVTPNTTVVNFDQGEAPCTLVDASPLTNQFNHIGVTFSGSGSIVDQCSELISVSAQSGTNYLAIRPTTTESQEWITFSSPQTNALLSLAGVGSVNLYAYLGQTMVAEGAFNFGSTGGWLQPILVEAAGFDQLAISKTDESLSPWAIDDLYATPARAVPEPGTSGLLAAGLLGMLIGV